MKKTDIEDFCEQIGDGLVPMPKFLGREIYDINTRTYRFKDGTGVVPEELRISMEMEAGTGRGSWLRAWSKRWAWAERMARLALQKV